MNYTIKRLRHYYVVYLNGRPMNRPPFLSIEDAQDWIAGQPA
jgi:hypothetical protein